MALQDEKITPATDAEIEDFCFGMYDEEGRCMHCSGSPHDSSCPVMVWPRIKASITDDREKIAEEKGWRIEAEKALLAERVEMTKLKAKIEALEAEREYWSDQGNQIASTLCATRVEKDKVEVLLAHRDAEVLALRAEVAQLTECLDIYGHEAYS